MATTSCGTIFKIKDCGGTPGGTTNMLVFIYACSLGVCHPRSGWGKIETKRARFSLYVYPASQ